MQQMHPHDLSTREILQGNEEIASMIVAVASLIISRWSGRDLLMNNEATAMIIEEISFSLQDLSFPASRAFSAWKIYVRCKKTCIHVTVTPRNRYIKYLTYLRLRRSG